MNAVTGIYYICIYGNTAATYKLTVDNHDHDVFLKSGLSEAGYVDMNETVIYYYRDPILAKPDVNISFTLHVMTGVARLKANLCAVNFTDKYEDYFKNCTYTTEDMFKMNPDERQENHLGSETEKTNPDICKLPPSNSSRDAQVSCVYVIGVIGAANYSTHYSVMLKV